jgi:protein associated with RNAse G/E
LVVKKLEWILHENDIHYIMPFLSDVFLHLAKSTQTVDKKEYKEFIKATLPGAITKMLAKKGGMVQEYYFIPQSYTEKFLALISTPKYST